jgi:hypothetical protein
MKLCPLLFLLLIGFELSAQEYLSLQKPFRFKNITYRQGDLLKFKTYKERGRKEGFLLSFDETSFRLDDGRAYQIKDVRTVIRGPERGGIVVAAPTKVVIAAVVFLLADMFSSSGFSPGPPTFIITGAIASSALLFLPFRNRLHRKSFGWRLYYVNPSSLKVPIPEN